MSDSNKLHGLMLLAITEALQPLLDELELHKLQLAQLRKDNQLLQNRLDRITHQQQHSDQSMY